MNKEENNEEEYFDNTLLLESIALEEFMISIGLRDLLLAKCQSLGIISIPKLIQAEEASLQKLLVEIDENQGRTLLKNLNLLSQFYKNFTETSIEAFTFDLGGVALSKEMIINGFKMKNKSHGMNLAYQQNFEKNNKVDNIFVSFLSNKGISSISLIETFKNMKHLYLSENKIQKISNLSPLSNLSVLDLKSNFIRKIEGLDSLINLQTLNLEQNCIKTLENLNNNYNLINLNVSNQILSKFIQFRIDETTMPIDSRVESINLENNQIADVRALKAFKCTKILKLKNNLIEELNFLLESIKEMPQLEVLNILNNPLKETQKSARDIIIIYGQNLVEINDKNVTSNERSFLNSFYSRKANPKALKAVTKKDSNLTVPITKIDETNRQSHFPNVKNFKYYNYK